MAVYEGQALVTLLVEAPIARLAISALGKGRAMPVMRMLEGDYVEPRSIIRGIVGSRIERTESNGDIHIQSVFALREPTCAPDGEYADDGCYWDGCGIVLRGRSMPETMAALTIGRPMTTVVDHPLLAGLTVSGVECEEDALIVDASDALWTIERIEREL